MPYCTVIEWHIFEFTLISNRVLLLLKKIWTSNWQRKRLAIIYHSFIFCESQLVYFADFYKWRPMRDGKILWKIVEKPISFVVSFDFFFWISDIFELFCCFRCWVWGFVLLFDWSHGGGDFGKTQRYLQSLFTSHWKLLKRVRWYFRVISAW